MFVLDFGGRPRARAVLRPLAHKSGSAGRRPPATPASRIQNPRTQKKILLLSRMSSDQPKFGIAFRYNLIHCQNRLSIIFANVFSVKIAKTQGRRRASKPEHKKARPNVFTNDTSIDWIRERHETTRAEENMIRRRKLKRTRTVPAQI